jgi:hypothetical protein
MARQRENVAAETNWSQPESNQSQLAVMYLRILAMIAVFNWSLAASLTPSLLALNALKALAPILDIIRKHAVHASLKAVDASRECPA